MTQYYNEQLNWRLSTDNTNKQTKLVEQWHICSFNADTTKINSQTDYAS